MAMFYERLKYHMNTFGMEPPPSEGFSSLDSMRSHFDEVATAVLLGSRAPFFTRAGAIMADLYLAVLAGSAAVAFCEVNKLPLPLELTYTQSMYILKLPAYILVAAIVDPYERKLRALLTSA